MTTLSVSQTCNRKTVTAQEVQLLLISLSNPFTNDTMSSKEEIEAKLAATRAEIQAKLAQMRAKAGIPAQQAPNPTPAPSKTSNLQKIPGLDQEDLQRRIAEARARVAGATQATSTAVGSMSQQRPRGGLNIAPPPLGLDKSGNIDLKAMLDQGIIPKRELATAKANQKQAKPAAMAPTVAASSTVSSANKQSNPYLSDRSEIGGRRSRHLKFVQPGRFIQKANQERAKAQLERLKQEIAEKAKLAGVQTERDIPDNLLKGPAPPDVEWWDLPITQNKRYEEMDADHLDLTGLENIITPYVQHPVPIKSPGEPTAQPPRQLMLTKRESKKLRRQKRLEAQKDKQDKIRLGLLPPEQPKVKISNLMRVLGQEAIQDPTQIEAKVRREMEERQREHEKANEVRKLTKEEKREKTISKLKEDVANMVHVSVYKVKKLKHPKLKYKIEVNARQLYLTGMVIATPKCNLVIVEGGPKGIKAYKKLMLRRIDWNDLPIPLKADSGDTDMQEPEEDDEEENKCFLVWEGVVKNAAFKKFTWREMESEKMARELLNGFKVEHYWDAAIMADDEELAARQPEL
ncbi:pre-mRNA processing factor 3-domain-containing protein [Umbelopsis sp. PMI_123]|nr:pre-mRNA processing factor 3-domain-containing protein [Umbelopsis sp. PMI_123]